MGYDPDKDDVMFLKLTREEAVAVSRAISRTISEGFDDEISDLLDKVHDRIAETKCQPENAYRTAWIFTSIGRDGEVSGNDLVHTGQENALAVAVAVAREGTCVIHQATLIDETEVELKLAPVAKTKAT